MTGNTIAKITAVSDLIRLPRQYGTALVLAPTLWALFIASGGRPRPLHLLIFILGAFLMRSAGCAINDLADREFDRRVERTKGRPVASGRLKPFEAFAVFLLFSAMAFALVLFLNRLALALSFVGVILAFVYPFTKRVSFFPQAFLGAAFGWGAIMAWAAVEGTVGIPAILIFVSNIFWSMAYDTIYALMDIDDDIKAGVKSTAIFFGKSVYAALFLLYSAMILTMGFAGWAAGLGPVYYGGLAASYALFSAIVFRLKKNPAYRAAFRGFVGNAVVGFLILFSIIADMNG
ncbi:MAG: 4-hydroxybenzoate octaprenyltransferase [Deltaproteobacteria bacterium]|nr:4-hydroxybenzoate octaprenyltransferase [Deltaproteobacteria bacterium]